MKQEKIFEALTDIGDDLLEMAQNRRFINHWKRWGRTAACLALVICLTALALPYFPVGCGSSSHETAAPAPEAAPAPQAPSAAPEEAPAPEAAPEEAVPESAPTADSTETVTVWFADAAYELQSGVLEAPEDLGEPLGEVETSDGRDLNGCLIFAVLESEDIYVQVPEGYLRGEKQK